jgi:hypothetical protein
MRLIISCWLAVRNATPSAHYYCTIIISVWNENRPQITYTGTRQHSLVYRIQVSNVTMLCRYLWYLYFCVWYRYDGTCGTVICVWYRYVGACGTVTLVFVVQVGGCLWCRYVGALIPLCSCLWCRYVGALVP